MLKDMVSISHSLGSKPMGREGRTSFIWQVYRNIEGNNSDLYQLLLGEAILQSLQSKRHGSLQLDKEGEAGFSLLKCGGGSF